MSIKDETNNSRTDHSIDSRKSAFSNESAKEYDHLLRKLEEESREHIKIEQQLKLYIDSMDEQADESEKTIKRLNNDIKKKNIEIHDLEKKLKEVSEKYDEIKLKVENLEKNPSPIKETIDQLHTQVSTTIENKGIKLNTENSYIKRVSKRVYFPIHLVIE